MTENAPRSAETVARHGQPGWHRVPVALRSLIIAAWAVNIVLAGVIAALANGTALLLVALCATVAGLAAGVFFAAALTRFTGRA